MNKINSLVALSLVSLLFTTECKSGDFHPTYIQEREATQEAKGRFLDSPVANLEYLTDSKKSGVTDINGTFLYIKGDSVKFSIGKLILGNAKPKRGTVTPKDLTKDRETFTLTLQLLQSLDADSNSSNGIEIPQEVLASLREKSREIHISQLDESSLIELDKTLKRYIDRDGNGKLDVDPIKAQNHFNNTVKKLNISPSRAPKRWIHREYYNPNSNKDGYSLTDNIKNAIVYLEEQEKISYDTYTYLYNYHKSENGIELKELLEIAEGSEKSHIALIGGLIDKYKIDREESRGKINQNQTPKILEELQEIGEASPEDALKVGCKLEVQNINTLKKYQYRAKSIENKDVENAFNLLRLEDYRHYNKFDEALKKLGVEDGCCAVDNSDGVNYCLNKRDRRTPQF